MNNIFIQLCGSSYLAKFFWLYDLEGSSKESKAKFVLIAVQKWANLFVECALFVMQDYLTDTWNLSFTHAAAILNIWSGISMVLPFFFLLVAETKLGHFWMVVLSSIAYTAGIGLIAMSTPPALSNLTDTCKQYKSECIDKTQKVIFYVGMAVLAVGKAGQSVSIKPLLEEQGIISSSTMKFYIRSLIRLMIIPIVGGYIFAKIKTWSLLFGIPAIGSTVAVILFLSGWNMYTKVKPERCAFTTACRVFVAAARKISQPFPGDPQRFYKKDDKESFASTRRLGCLEKAAMILPGEVGVEGELKNRWKLCSIAEVEEAKIAVRMVPMWMTFTVLGIVSSIGNTYFIEQASKMNRHIRNSNFPLQTFALILTFTNLDSYPPAADGDAGTVISSGMIYSVLCCITAALVEKRRLKVIITHGLLDRPDEVIPMSVLWLLFQFYLLLFQDVCVGSGVARFFEDEKPESMRDYLDQLSRGARGLGYMFGVLSVYVCGRVSQIGGRKGWFQFTLNKSRLDRYYWFLAALSSVNLLAFILVSDLYKSSDNAQDEEMDGSQTSHGTGGRED